jgi:hypothetical protein
VRAAAETETAETAAETSVVGTFEPSDGHSITFKTDSSFTTEGWEGREGGTYELVQGQMGMNVDLTFDGGSEYTMYVIIAMYDVAAVNDAQGNQFNKKSTQRMLMPGA